MEKFSSCPPENIEEKIVMPPTSRWISHYSTRYRRHRQERGEATFKESSSDWIPHIAHDKISAKISRKSYDIIKGTTESIKNITVKTAEKAAELADSTYSKIKVFTVRSFEWLKIIVWKILMYVGIPVTVILIVAAIVYLYVKFWWASRATIGINAALKALKINAVEDDSEIGENTEMINNVGENETTATRTSQDQSFFFAPYVVMTLVASATASPLPYVPVHINGSPVVCLLDTGSSISFMKIATLQQLKGQNLKPTKSPRTARTANGSQFSFIGRTQTVISFGSLHIKHEMLVTNNNNCPAPALLGSDLIKRASTLGHSITLELKENKAFLGKEEIPLLAPGDKGHQNGATYSVKATEECILKPQSDTMIEGTLEIQCPTNIEVFVEPFKEFPAILIGKTLCKPRKETQVILRVLNPTLEKQKIRKGTKLAVAEIADKSLYKIETAYSVIESENDKFYTCPEVDWENKLPKWPSNNQDFESFLQENINLSETILNSKEQEELLEIIRRHKTAFVGPDGKIGHYKGKIKHRVPLIPGSIPTKRFYRVPLEYERKLRNRSS